MAGYIYLKTKDSKPNTKVEEKNSEETEEETITYSLDEIIDKYGIKSDLKPLLNELKSADHYCNDGEYQNWIFVFLKRERNILMIITRLLKSLM